MYVQDYVHFPPPSVGAAAERDERIHDQVGELSAVFCSPRSREKVRFSEEVFPEPSELAGTLGERRGIVLECL